MQLMKQECPLALVYATAALHEMPHDTRQNVLAEARRLLKPEGRLVVGDHHRPPRRWMAWLWQAFERLTPEYATHRDLLERGLETEIRQAGFLVLNRVLTNAGILQVVVCRRWR